MKNQVIQLLPLDSPIKKKLRGCLSAQPSTGKEQNKPVTEQERLSFALLRERKLICRQGWYISKWLEKAPLKDDWLRGLIEAEGSFTQNRERKKPIFEITQLAIDSALIHSIRNKLGVGHVRISQRDDGRRCAVYSLTNRGDIIRCLLPILEKGFVFSKARLSYLRWLDTHFKPLTNLLEVYSSDQAKAGLTHGYDPSAFNVNWLHGFTDGDGSFHFIIRKQKDYRFSYQVQAVFDLSQKVGKLELMGLGNHLFGENNYSITMDKSGSHLKVVRLNVLMGQVTNLFAHGQGLKSRKRIDYLLWSLGITLMADKAHLKVWSLSFLKRIIGLQKYYRKN